MNDKPHGVTREGWMAFAKELRDALAQAMLRLKSAGVVCGCGPAPLGELCPGHAGLDLYERALFVDGQRSEAPGAPQRGEQPQGPTRK